MSGFSSIKKWVQCAREDVRLMRAADPDVVEVVSFPKCGRTWLKYMLAELLPRAYGIEQETHTVEVRQLSQKINGAPKIGWSHDGGEFITEDGRHPDPKLLFIYGRRLRYKRNRIILLVRDPRDTVVSHFHQVTRRSLNPMKFESMSAFVRDPIYGFNRILRYYEIWRQNRNVPRDLMLVRYEDMMARGAEALGEIAAYIGVQNTTPEMISEVYEFCRAENMRKMEAKGQIEGMRKFGEDENSLKVRKARTGTYREELSAEDIEYCNRQLRSLSQWYGYSPNGVK